MPNLFQHRRNYFRPTWREELAENKVLSIVGLVLILWGGYISFTNERQTVRTHQSLDEGYKKIVLPQTLKVVFEENNGKPVWLAGNLDVKDELSDKSYGISITAVKLWKRVQRYQWYEEERSDRGPGEYDYYTDWFQDYINSADFAHSLGHHNPEDWPINSTILTNSRVKIGGFLLGTDLKEKFDEEFIPFTSDERPPPSSGIKMHAGLYFHAKDVWSPEVGDIRIQFSYAGRHGEPYTVIGMQSGREIRPYQTENGEELLLLHPGIKRVDQVFLAERKGTRFQMWTYRFIGWILSFIGFSCIGSILEILVDDYPVVRSTLSLGSANLSFSCSVAVTLIIIGFSWLIYRPFLGILLFVIALSPFVIAGYQFYLQRVFETNHRLS
ncbi:transmembrane protein 43 [Lepeophtheirus salmonis]|uniref:Transmembrane protein 43 homolog [Bombus terrestris] n=1 Tax=Lepeophtheirus salmonis TaxID=72036 RepID=A0A0K2TRW4_LEPSM|nr:transmembrane protein 43-like [Lepeophtheirus salmonis]